MKNDFSSLCVAEIELAEVRFSKGKELGFDLINEIDVWSKMEFKFRHQIHHLNKHGKIVKDSCRGRTDLHSLVYSIREKLE